jgi:hypothetical protein
MAADQEPYSVAARNLDAAPPSSDAMAEVIARANATLAAPSARIEFRRDADLGALARGERPRPGPAGRLARRAAGAVWKRIAPGVDPAELREAFLHPAGVGFVLPANARYQLDYGRYAQLYLDGVLMGGPPGAPLRANNRVGRSQPPEDDALGILGILARLREGTEARYTGAETLHGTPCRTVAVLAGAAEFTVWIDEQHVRRIRSERRGPDPREAFSVRQTIELWDFGVPVGALDWTRLPRLRGLDLD